MLYLSDSPFFENITTDIMNENQLAGSTIGQRSMKGLNVVLIKNEYPRGEPKRYHFTTFEKLLSDAAGLLGLSNVARKVFDENGKRLNATSEISNQQKLFISTGEKFHTGQPASSPRKPRTPRTPSRSRAGSEAKVEEEEESVPERPPSVMTQASERLDVKSTKPVSDLFSSCQFLVDRYKKKQEEKAAKQREEEEKKQQEEELNKPVVAKKSECRKMVQGMTQTVEEKFRNESLAKFANMKESQKKEMANRKRVENLMRSTQHQHLLETLVKLNIASSTTNGRLRKEISDVLTNLLVDLDPLEAKFVLTGPRNSGKTGVLYSLVARLYSKLLKNEQTCLVFPLNFDNLQDDMKSVVGIYNLFVNTAMYSAKYCAMQLLPNIDHLTKWFLEIPRNMVLNPIPQVFEKVHGIRFRQIFKIGQEFTDAFNDKKAKECSRILRLIAEFPMKLAKALRLQTVLFVVDHMDLCHTEIVDTASYPVSFRPAFFGPVFAEAVGAAPHVVATQKDSEFCKHLIETSTHIDMLNLVKIDVAMTLTIPELDLKLGLEDCMGCPGFINLFLSICQQVYELNRETQFPSKFSTVRSTIDGSRLNLIQKGIESLFGSLLEAGSEIITRKRAADFDPEVIRHPTIDPNDAESLEDNLGQSQFFRIDSSMTYRK